MCTEAHSDIVNRLHYISKNYFSDMILNEIMVLMIDGH